MSRLGKLPIALPAGTEAHISDGVISVKGKGGELRRTFPEALVEVTLADKQITVAPKAETSDAHVMWGTIASHVRNMVAGVNEPFVKKLVVEGVGYKVALNNSEIELQVGFSHKVTIPVPQGLTVEVEKNEISIKGIDKEMVGQFAANIRKVKKPEPYKGKGIRYEDEVVRRKEGKRAV